MRSSAARIEHQDECAGTDRPTGEFLRELSVLCQKYGVGITGDATLFCLEQDDYAYNYGIDDQARLIWGSGE